MRMLLTTLVCGLIFLGVGGFITQETSIDPSWAKTTGTVVSVVTDHARYSSGTGTHTPVIEYTVRDQKYRVTSQISDGTYPDVGTSREVAYNPAQPGEAKVVGSVVNRGFLFIFPLVGLGLVILGPILYLRSRRRGRAIQRLMQHGYKLEGVLTDLQSPDGGKSIKVVVSAIDPAGTPRTYVSDPINGLGLLTLSDELTRNPLKIDVYVDPANPQNYYVDIADLPELNAERINLLVQRAKSSGLIDVDASGNAPAQNPPDTPPGAPDDTNTKPPLPPPR